MELRIQRQVLRYINTQEFQTEYIGSIYGKKKRISAGRKLKEYQILYVFFKVALPTAIELLRTIDEKVRTIDEKDGRGAEDWYRSFITAISKQEAFIECSRAGTIIRVLFEMTERKLSDLGHDLEEKEKLFNKIKIACMLLLPLLKENNNKS